MFPRHVLLITDRYPPQVGGLARSSQRLAGHAARSGARVEVLVIGAGTSGVGEGAPGSLSSSCEEGLLVHRLGAFRTIAESGQHAAQAIDWLHEREPFDLLHGQYASTG